MNFPTKYYLWNLVKLHDLFHGFLHINLIRLTNPNLGKSKFKILSKKKKENAIIMYKCIIQNTSYMLFAKSKFYIIRIYCNPSNL